MIFIKEILNYTDGQVPMGNKHIDKYTSVSIMLINILNLNPYFVLKLSRHSS